MDSRGKSNNSSSISNNTNDSIAQLSVCHASVGSAIPQALCHIRHATGPRDNDSNSSTSVSGLRRTKLTNAYSIPYHARENYYGCLDKPFLWLARKVSGDDHLHFVEKQQQQEEEEDPWTDSDSTEM
jgi:hypothetical protein